MVGDVIDPFGSSLRIKMVGTFGQQDGTGLCRIVRGSNLLQRLGHQGRVVLPFARLQAIVAQVVLLGRLAAGGQ